MVLLPRLVVYSTVCIALAVGVSFWDDGKTPQLAIVKAGVEDIWALLRPGGQLHPAEFIAHKGHLAIEGFLLVAVSFLLFQSSFKPKSHKVGETPLTEKEIDELCAEWEPEPLYGTLTEFQRTTVDSTPVVESQIGTKITLKNGKKCINMISPNFLGLAKDSVLKDAAAEAIQKYGVGSCGPRGFYGTIDVHLELEDRLAKFMGTEECILYSYDLATLPSIIPAFANKRDLIVCDECVNYAIQNGCNLSRARTLFFKHNDITDLERLLKDVAAEDKRRPRPLNRRFIVVEGIYAHHGDLSPLGDIIRLKNQYKYRLIVDESLSLGVLGSNGKGAWEHSGAQVEDIEIIGASLGNSLAGIGGFCAGEREIVDHQRLSGAGYCFSASLPPFLASTAVAALDQMEGKDFKKRMNRLHQNATLFRSLASSSKLGTFLRCVGGEGVVSPLVHLRLVQDSLRKMSFEEGDMLLQNIVDYCMNEKGVAFTVAKYSVLEKRRPAPSLKVAVTADHTEADIRVAVEALAAACRKIF